jgi:hypothetical protein
MKKIIAFITVVTIVLSSCSSLKNTVVLKRKYNKGFYVAHQNSKHKVSLTQNENQSQSVQKSERLESLNVSNNLVNEINDLKPMSMNQVVELKHNTILSDPKIALTSKSNMVFKPNYKPLVLVKKTQAKPTFDTELLILVILSLFPILALVAIFIKEGKVITTNFWVDLVLHFTLIGYIIFALLVVLDIINLS